MKQCNFYALCFYLVLPVLGYNQVNFEQVGEAIGIAQAYGVGSSGGGVSFCDFNGDGWDDLTFASQTGDSLYFFQNIEGTFVQIPALVPNTFETKQILWVDFDNDGDKDLFVTAKEGNCKLYERIENSELVDITASAGLGDHFNDFYGACWGDINRDGLLDLFVTQRNIQFSTNRNYLFLNNGNKTFEEIAEATNVDDPGKAPFCAAFMDYNNDKWPDLYLAQDKTKINTLLKNMGQGIFQNNSVLAGANLAMNAMSVAVGDYNRDGWQDLYISNTPQGNRLLKNDGDETFTEVSISTGTTFNGTAWGALFLDLDNDGWEDLYVSGSGVGAALNSSALYINDRAGAFELQEGIMLGDTVSSYGNAAGDFNNDGAIDLAVVNMGDFPYHIWENTSTAGHFLKVRLEGVLSNRDGVGAKVTVYENGEVQLRYKHCGIGYLGQNMSAIHFGLGEATTVDSLLVEWPTGHIDRWGAIEANQEWIAIEGSTTNGTIAIDPDIGLTDLEEINNDLEVRYFPNPASKIVWLSVKQHAWVRLIDHNGQTLNTWEVNEGSQILPVQSYPAGTYWLMIWNGTESTSVPLVLVR